MDNLTPESAVVHDMLNTIWDLQDNSAEQMINRGGDGGHCRRLVDEFCAKLNDLCSERIAAAVKAARVETLKEALAILDEHSALRSFDLIEALITNAENEAHAALNPQPVGETP